MTTGYQGVEYVAHPPMKPGATPHATPKPVRYYGPPAYPVPPRWGFPRTPTWFHPIIARTRATTTAEKTAIAARYALIVLFGTAASLLVATGAEIWRYALLAIGQDGLLSISTVNASDFLVDIANVFAYFFGVASILGGLWWIMRYREQLAEDRGELPARTRLHTVLGFLLPGFNIGTPLSIVAEFEHTALARPPHEKPRPSRLVLAWWGTWLASGTLLVVNHLWDLRTGAQAEADGVLWHAISDLASCGLVAVSGLVLLYLGALLRPAPTTLAHRRVVSVSAREKVARKARTTAR
jgi:hypothetical protein